MSQAEIGLEMIEESEKFSGTWPRAPFVRLPNAGHFSQEDAPETRVAMTEQFVALSSPA